jgi:hypothetical protein
MGRVFEKIFPRAVFEANFHHVEGFGVLYAQSRDPIVRVVPIAAAAGTAAV